MQNKVKVSGFNPDFGYLLTQVRSQCFSAKATSNDLPEKDATTAFKGQVTEKPNSAPWGLPMTATPHDMVG